MVEPKPIRLGKYLLLEKIAEGGIAQLYRAKVIGVQDPEKVVAVKRILPHLSGIRDLASTFIDEAKLVSLLSHRNIVRIYDVGHIEGSYFIAMEYLLGKDLRYIFNKSREKNIPLSPENALYIISQICSGLDYAHKLTDPQAELPRIIHRDINPRNILVTYEGEVKIVDFGIVRATSKSSVTKHEMIKKKVAYMSPEQALGEKIDAQSDIFSTGILLYEITTNKRMYDGEPLQVLAKVRKAEFEPPEISMNGLPPKLYMILNRALAREKAQRYQSCGEMQAEIEECMSDLSVRPTAQELAEYVRELFREEIEVEGRTLNKATTAIPAPLVFALADPALAVAQPTVLSPVVHKWVGSNGGGPGPLGSIPAVSEPEAGSGMNAPLAEKISEKAKGTIEKKETAKRRKYWIYYGALVAVLAVIGLGWAFWPKEEPVSARDRDTFRPPVSEPSREAAPEKAADRYAEARALRDRAEGITEKNPLEAQSMLLKAIELDPQNGRGHFLMGLTYMTLKNSPKAIQAYQKVIELDPQFPDSYFNLGYLYGTDENYSKAEQMYSQVVRLAPSYLDEALYNLSLVQEKQGKRRQSIENLERALQINPKNEMAQKFLNKLKGVS